MSFLSFLVLWMVFSHLEGTRLTPSKTCYNYGDVVVLTLAYTGGGAPSSIDVKFSKMTTSDNLLILISGGMCSSFGSADQAIPVSRMTFPCDESKKEYNISISDFSDNDTGVWEASLSVSGTPTQFYSAEVSVCLWSTTTSSTTTSTSFTTTTPTVNASTTSAATYLPTTTFKITSVDPRIIIPACVVPFVTLLIFFFACCWLRRKRNNKKKKDNS